MAKRKEKRTVSEVLDQCEEIIELIDNEIPEYALDTAGEFFESVREKVSRMADQIDDCGNVTDKQAEALDNMEYGVRRWIK